jgi:hypothetical protein
MFLTASTAVSADRRFGAFDIGGPASVGAACGGWLPSIAKFLGVQFSATGAYFETDLHLEDIVRFERRPWGLAEETSPVPASQLVAEPSATISFKHRASFPLPGQSELIGRNRDLTTSQFVGIRAFPKPKVDVVRG